MSRVSKRKFIKILKGDYDPPTMSKDSILDMFKNMKIKKKKDDHLKHIFPNEESAFFLLQKLKKSWPKFIQSPTTRAF